jgi:hypothetical protein
MATNKDKHNIRGAESNNNNIHLMLLSRRELVKFPSSIKVEGLIFYSD